MIDRLKDAIFGFAVGDALGVPYEFKKRNSFQCSGMIGYGTWGQPAGTWSDDTSMTIATCDSIRETGKIDVQDMRQRFVSLYRKAEYTANGETFDIGTTTAQALTYGRGMTDEMSNGNGSLMRILPIAFTKHSINDIYNVSGITHAHDISKIACELYVSVAENLISGMRPWAAVLEICQCVSLPKEFERLEYLRRLTVDEIKSTGYVVDTLEAALWCLITSGNYAETVLKAVNLGGDTDTIAAVAGGLAGIKYGMKGIPKEWIEKLKNKELIERCLF